MMFYENNGFILDVLEDSIVLHDNGYWKEMKEEFLDRKKLGAIKRIKNGWKIKGKWLMWGHSPKKRKSR